MTPSLLALCLLCQPNPAGARNDRILDIDQIQAGLQALTNSWTSREIHYTWSQAFPSDAPQNSPPRKEGWIRQAADGRFLRNEVQDLNGKPFQRVCQAWDGEQYTYAIIRLAEPPNGIKVPKPGLDVSKAPRVRFDGYSLHQDLVCLQRPLFEWLDEPSAEITGRRIVDGARCIRVEVTIPAGHEGAQVERRLRIDVDPEKDFWPRRFDTATLPASEEEFGSEHLFQDFRQVDGQWFPHETTMNWPGDNGESRLKIHQVAHKVVFNAPISEDFFLPDIPEGTPGIDHLRNRKAFTWSAQTPNAEGIPDPPARKPWRMPSLAFGSMPLVVAIAILGCCLVVQVLRRRKAVEKNYH